MLLLCVCVCVYYFCNVFFLFLCNFFSRACMVVYRQDEKEKNIEKKKKTNQQENFKELFSFSMELEELRQVTRSFVL